MSTVCIIIVVILTIVILAMIPCVLGLGTDDASERAPFLVTWVRGATRHRRLATSIPTPEAFAPLLPAWRCVLFSRVLRRCCPLREGVG